MDIFNRKKEKEPILQINEIMQQKMEQFRTQFITEIDINQKNLLFFETSPELEKLAMECQTAWYNLNDMKPPQEIGSMFCVPALKALMVLQDNATYGKQQFRITRTEFNKAEKTFHIHLHPESNISMDTISFIADSTGFLVFKILVAYTSEKIPAKKVVLDTGETITTDEDGVDVIIKTSYSHLICELSANVKQNMPRAVETINIPHTAKVVY